MSPASGEILVHCRAKLNLVLEIIGKRSDGYHDIATVMHPIDLADGLTIRRGVTGITLKTSGLPSPEGDENVAYRAARRFYDALGSPPAVELQLHKRIPAEAGLGGGSAGAAGVLGGLALMHGWPPDDPRLLEIARRLGADIPFLLSRGAALAEGIGEKLTPLPPAEFACVLALGSPGVNTKWAYGQVGPEHYTDGARARRAALSLLRSRRVGECWNGFAPALAGARPDLAELTQSIAESIGGPAAMTGSGACVFGIAPGEPEAQQAAETLRQRGYWTWWGRSAVEPITVTDGSTDDAGGGTA